MHDESGPGDRRVHGEGRVPRRGTGLRCLEWRCTEPDVASGRSAGCLGYRSQGWRRAAVHLDGRWVDGLLVGPVREEAEELLDFAGHGGLVVPNGDNV